MTWPACDKCWNSLDDLMVMLTNCPKCGAVIPDAPMYRQKPSNDKRENLRLGPWQGPFTYDAARGYIYDAHGAYVCVARSAVKDEHNALIAVALSAYAAQFATPAGDKLQSTALMALYRECFYEVFPGCAGETPVLQVMALRLFAERWGAQQSATTERDASIHANDCPTFREFYMKHSLGSKLPPSCLVCGHAQPDRDEWAIRHMELPNIIVCRTCRDRSQYVGQKT